MACEVPTVVSAIPSFKEVGGEFSVYVDPKNVESIKGGIVQVFSTGSSQKVQNKVKAAKERANTFTWEGTARNSLRVFENLIKNG